MARKVALALLLLGIWGLAAPAAQAQTPTITFNWKTPPNHYLGARWVNPLHFRTDRVSGSAVTVQMMVNRTGMTPGSNPLPAVWSIPSGTGVTVAVRSNTEPGTVFTTVRCNPKAVNTKLKATVAGLGSRTTTVNAICSSRGTQGDFLQ